MLAVEPAIETRNQFLQTVRSTDVGSWQKPECAESMASGPVKLLIGGFTVSYNQDEFDGEARKKGFSGFKVELVDPTGSRLVLEGGSAALVADRVEGKMYVMCRMLENRIADVADKLDSAPAGLPGIRWNEAKDAGGRRQISAEVDGVQIRVREINSSGNAADSENAHEIELSAASGPVESSVTFPGEKASKVFRAVLGR